MRERQERVNAVVVNRVSNTLKGPREAYRDDSLSCGHRWPSADAAIAFAMARARDVILKERFRLAC